MPGRRWTRPPARRRWPSPAAALRRARGRLSPGSCTRAVTARCGRPLVSRGKRAATWQHASSQRSSYCCASCGSSLLQLCAGLCPATSGPRARSSCWSCPSKLRWDKWQGGTSGGSGGGGVTSLVLGLGSAMRACAPKAPSGRSPEAAASSPISALPGASLMPLLIRSKTLPARAAPAASRTAPTLGAV